ncbi:MAG TPA: ABC transporter transmembrane domain-containing protein, partial [Candidatus Paceibacterota bacterium]|nr:ABC transporter transmembrane domain-containing protein [Candidatus Paceibacterota bacterium]
MFSLSRIFRYLWPHIKKYWLSGALVFLGYLIGIIFDSILKPYLYKEIIDALSSGLPREVILSRAMYLIMLIIGAVVIHYVSYRAGDYANSYFQSKVMKRLHDFTFRMLMGHSYTFFSNNFSGSIVAKAKRFTKSFENFADVISFQVWFSLVTLIGIFIVLFFVNHLLAYIFLFWAILYIVVTLLFIRRKIRYDILEAEADSRVTARLADAILNIMNIKIFSSRHREEEGFQSVTADEEQKRRTDWYFGNLQNAMQALLMAILQVSVIFVSVKLWYLGKITLGTIVLT